MAWVWLGEPIHLIGWSSARLRRIRCFAGAAVAGWLGLASAAGILTAAEADIYSCVTLNEKSPMLTISKRR